MEKCPATKCQSPICACSGWYNRCNQRENVTCRVSKVMHIGVIWCCHLFSRVPPRCSYKQVYTYIQSIHFTGFSSLIAYIGRDLLMKMKKCGFNTPNHEHIELSLDHRIPLFIDSSCMLLCMSD